MQIASGYTAAFFGLDKASTRKDMLDSSELSPLEDEMSFMIAVRQSGGVTVLDLTGRLTIGDPAAEFRHTFRTQAERNSRFVLNLAQLTFIDSAGLRELVNAYARIGELNGELKFAAIQRKVRDVFRITKLNAVFEAYDDEDAALRSFSERAGS